MPFTTLAGTEINNQTIIFNLNNDPEDYLSLTVQELRDLIDNKKESPFKVVGINRTIPSVSADTLEKDNILPNENDLYLERAEKLRENPDFIFKINEIFNDREKPIYANSYTEEQLYSGGFPNQIDRDRMKNFHNAESLKEKLSITNSFEDERYRDFAIRICAQEFPADIDVKYLQHCKDLVKTRFTDTGPWPNSDNYLKEGNSLLEELNSPEEKKLVNLAINSIKSSRN
jgi:exonuclease I